MTKIILSAIDYMAPVFGIQSGNITTAAVIISAIRDLHSNLVKSYGTTSLLVHWSVVTNGVLREQNCCGPFRVHVYERKRDGV